VQQDTLIFNLKLLVSLMMASIERLTNGTTA
jgi:hypothetical protein